MAGAFSWRHILVRKHSPRMGAALLFASRRDLIGPPISTEIASSRQSEPRSHMRNQNPIPEVQCFEIHQASVPLFPSAGDNVTLQTGKLRVNIADFGERG